MNGKSKLITTGVSLGFFLTLAIGYGKVQERVKGNKEEIKEVKVVVKKNTEDIDLEENINIKQTALLEQLTTTVKELNAELKAR